MGVHQQKNEFSRAAHINEKMNIPVQRTARVAIVVA